MIFSSRPFHDLWIWFAQFMGTPDTDRKERVVMSEMLMEAC